MNHANGLILLICLLQLHYLNTRRRRIRHKCHMSRPWMVILQDKSFEDANDWLDRLNIQQPHSAIRVVCPRWSSILKRIVYNNVVAVQGRNLFLWLFTLLWKHINNETLLTYFADVQQRKYLSTCTGQLSLVSIVFNVDILHQVVPTNQSSA